MRFQNRMILLICSLLLFVLLLPLGQLRADGTFGVTDYKYTSMADTSTAVPMMDGAIVPRKMSSFIFTITQPVAEPATLSQLITLQDSSGQKVNYQLNGPFGGANSPQTVSLTVNTTLNRNETYTLTIKGGTDGLKDTQGDTLPADATITFKTQDVVEYQTCSFGTAPDLAMLTFTAEQGPLDVYTNTLQPGAEVDVTVTDLATQQHVIQDAIIDNGKTTYTLPKTGDYEIDVRSRMAGPEEWPTGFSVGANEMNMPDCGKLPVIDTMMNKSDLNVYDSTYRIEPQFMSSNQKVQFVQYYLDGKLMQNNVYSTDQYGNGQISFADVNPDNLADGIHTVEYYTESTTSQSASAAISHFAVLKHGYLYYDVTPDHWAFEPIETMSYWGILHGVGSQDFAPSRPTTREEFAAMVAQTFHLKATKSTWYSDVPNGAWSKPYVDALSQKGLMLGNGSNFGAKSPITRADAVTVIGKALQVDTKHWSSYGFKDFNAIPSYALPYVMYMANTSLIHGDENGYFNPKAPLTRAEAAQILSKFLPW